MRRIEDTRSWANTGRYGETVRCASQKGGRKFEAVRQAVMKGPRSARETNVIPVDADLGFEVGCREGASQEVDRRTNGSPLAINLPLVSNSQSQTLHARDMSGWDCQISKNKASTPFTWLRCAPILAKAIFQATL